MPLRRGMCGDAKAMKVAVHWFRCDLRLGDNTALHAAVLASEVVVPIFIFDPKILKAPDVSSCQVAFMIDSLRALERDVAGARRQNHFPARRRGGGDARGVA